MASAFAASAAVHLAFVALLAPAGGFPGTLVSGRASLQVRLDTQPESAVQEPAPVELAARGSSTPRPRAPDASTGAAPARGITAPPRYFKSSELDERAAPIHQPPLVFPEHLWINRLRGRVLARVFISDDGAVDSVTILESTMADFEQPAVDAVRGMRFRAGVKDGRPVRSQKTIEIEFDPYGPRPGDPPR